MIWSDSSLSMAGCQVMEKLSDYLDSEIASIMANIVPCHGQCRFPWKECWARFTRDSTRMQFRMDRTDQFIALQYMYSESLVSSSAFDKVKFQDHLWVGISLEP